MRLVSDTSFFLWRPNEKCFDLRKKAIHLQKTQEKHFLQARGLPL